MSNSPVSISVEDKVAIITMDDGKANALSHEMVAKLQEAFDQAEAEANSVVLAGRDGKFCAGFDLSVMMKGPEQARKLVIAGGKLFLRLYDFPLPIVVACTGHAVAGGVLLAATGDVRIGANGSFKFGLNEVAVGLAVPILAHQFALDRLSPQEVYPAVVLAKMYNPEAAVQAGWLDRVADPGDVRTNSIAEATRLGQLPRAAYTTTKRSLRKRSIDYIRSTMEQNIADLTVPGGR